MVANAGVKSQERAERLVYAITGYGFNKAHAVAYAVLGYQTAWYKVHYPFHFCHSWLVVKEKHPHRRKYELMTVEMGVPLLHPHVNGSASYTIEELEGEKAIRRGYLQVKGVGPSAAEAIAENAPYESVTDFEERCDVNVGVVKALREGGALEFDVEEQIRMASAYMRKLRWMR
jgi:DNA polymerase III alpha subunit